MNDNNDGCSVGDSHDGIDDGIVLTEKLAAAELRIRELENLISKSTVQYPAETGLRIYKADSDCQITYAEKQSEPTDSCISSDAACSPLAVPLKGPQEDGSVAKWFDGGVRRDDSRDRARPEACANGVCKPSVGWQEASGLGRVFNSLSNLPKREIVRFNGDPMRYWLFIRSFQSSVLNVVQDPEARLSYLIHYCDGEAKEAIESCAILEPEEGFRDAMETLKTRFGRPHLIARAHINQLVSGPIVRTNDEDALNKLVIQMKACLNTLQQMQYEADLNASVTVAAIVRRLPHALQLDWFKMASNILRTPREPTFKDLYEFVCNCAEIAAAQSMYIGEPSQRRDGFYKNERSETRGNRIASLATRVVDESKPGYVLSCLECNGNHYMDQCSQFRAMSIAERLSTVSKQRLCQLCLKANHSSMSCRSRNKCGLGGCQSKHHPLLHHEKTTFPSSERATINATTSYNSRVALGVIPVRLRSSEKVIEVNALLDSGSDSTLIDEQLLRELKLETRSAVLNVSTVTKASRFLSSSTEIDIYPLDGGKPIHVNQAWSVKKMPQIQRVVPSLEQLTRWKHMQDITFPDNRGREVGLLIGMNVPEAHWTLEQRRGNPTEPFATRTPLGWMLLGQVDGDERKGSCINAICGKPNEDSAFLESMYELEFSEPNSCRLALSVEDKDALEQMKSSIVKRGVHYEISLPWKYGCPALPNNYPVAYQRLMSLRRRFTKDPAMHRLYTTGVEDYLMKGFAEPVRPGRPGWGKSFWYIPHHAVTHPNKPGKIRVVFDCASSYQGTSLNQQLLKGPDLVNSLVGVLMRFRVGRIAVVADIEAMFHQVKIPTSDMDCLRFLWWPNGQFHLEPAIFRMTVHPFGATSSPSCASFALNRTIEDCVEEFPHSTLSVMKESFYVDDCLFSCESVEEARSLVSQFKVIASKGGFNLTKWMSNDNRALPIQSIEPVSSDCGNRDLQPCYMHPTLGVMWNIYGDYITIRLTKADAGCTRRALLSFVASIYDPLGFVAPVLLPAKLLLQSFVRKNMDWDAIADEAEMSEWHSFLVDIRSLEQVKIPRSLIPMTFTAVDMKLHCFSDASELGYGAVVYARIESDDKRVVCSILMGKSRVSPIKSVTIPRLELTAAVLAARLAAQAMEELKLKSKPTFWVDSIVVLQLIRSTTKRFTTFTANRLSAIHQCSSPAQWRYVETSENPADLASRGIRASDERKLDRWFHGPEFLRRKESEWPTVPKELGEIPREWLKKDVISVYHCQAAGSWFDVFASCASWTMIRRRIAILLRFKKYLLLKSGRTTEVLDLGPLQPSDIQEAELEIVRVIQQDHFKGDIETIKNRTLKESSRCLKRLASPLRKLCPFLENGILRVGGRLNWSPLPYDARHPILLPSKHFATRLLILDYHERNGHVGASHVLSEIHQRYWILQGTSTVRRLLQHCAKCRIWNAKPCGQQMAPVSEDRFLVFQPAFTAVGIDYFGPLFVKHKRTREKRFGCIFTCLSVRAVHIEVTRAMDTDSFLCAFHRFVARRGVPSKIYSDNGLNFRGAEAELKDIINSWNQNKISCCLTERNCEWIFNPPYASHRGGVWERLIRSIRQIFRLITGDKIIDDEVLQTTMAEVERILNSRPLTPNPGHPDDFGALCPNQLLALTSERSTEPKEPQLPNRLSKRWRQVHHLSDEFWRRWMRCYLPALQNRQKWHERKRDLKVGDLVLVTDIRTSRGLWPKGIVEETKRGHDGLVREVVIRTNKGKFRRDVRQVCMLEETLTEENAAGPAIVGGV